MRSRTFDEGSWRRSSCGDTARCFDTGKLRSVESLRAAEVGRVVGKLMSQF